MIYLNDDFERLVDYLPPGGLSTDQKQIILHSCQQMYLVFFLGSSEVYRWWVKSLRAGVIAVHEAVM